ncbi:MAG TPA: oligosaccharide flippase family protein, partial [Gemmatimonadales bacterium]|nr:oligosaccharide flippase family protein [Gemmatimonadales bacterium]
MIYRTFARYVLATGVPAVVNFLALTIYSRLLRPAEYGTYSLVLAAVGVSNALAFQWIRSAARRYLPEDATRAELLSALRRVYGMLVAAAALVALAYALARPEHRLLAALGLGLLVVQAWFELNLEVLLADLRPGRYGAMALTRSVTGLAAGVALVLAGFGAAGVLLGHFVGYLLPAAWATPGVWRGLPSSAESGARIVTLARYGLPLTAGYALQFVVDSSDRFLLGALRTVAEVGGYAVSYDLAAQAITLLCMMVNLAAHPMALRALREQGETAARARLREQAAALVGVALPALVGIAVLSPGLAGALLGNDFLADATRLMPIVALGVFLGGLKAYYFDSAFQLGERTAGIVRVGLVA